jgi:hypothetical protein
MSFDQNFDHTFRGSFRSEAWKKEIRIPTAQVSALFYPNQALDKRQLISRLTSLHQHRNRFMHHRTLTPSPNLIQYP